MRVGVAVKMSLGNLLQKTNKIGPIPGELGNSSIGCLQSFLTKTMACLASLDLANTPRLVGWLLIGWSPLK